MYVLRRSILVFALGMGCVTKPASAQNNAEAAVVDRGGWIDQQLRRYHGYSHLDRSYRLMAEKRYAEARAELEKYLAVEPGSGPGRLSYLLVLYRQRDYAGIVAQPESWFSGYPEAATALLYRGLAHEALVALEPAAHDFVRAASLPGTAPAERRFALRSAGQIALRGGDARGAQHALEQLTGPTAAFNDYWQLGFAYEKQGLLPEADAAYWIAYGRTNDPGERLLALRSAAEVNRQQLRWESTDAALRMALKIAPSNGAVLAALAETAYARERFADATRWAEQALARQPSADLQALLGYARYGLRDYTGASAAFAAALEGRDEEEARYPLYLALAHSEYGARRPAVAISWLERALAVRTDFDVRALLANLQFGQHNYAAAARHFSALAEAGRSPRERYEAYMALGHAQNGQRAYADAARAFGRAVAISATPSALLAQGEALRNAGQLEQAAALQEQLAQRQDLAADLKGDLYTRQGFLLSELRQHERAAAAFRLALANGSRQRRTREALAIALYQAQQWRDASVEFRKLTAESPHAQDYLYLGLCYLKLDKPGLAIEALAPALPRAEELATTQQQDLHNALGSAFAAEYQYAAAAPHWRASLQVDDHPEIRLRLAQSQRGTGDLSDAQISLDAIDMLRLTPSLQADVWDERALLAAQQKRYCEAAAAASEASQIAPTPERRHRLALYLTENDRYQDAIVQWETAVASEPLNDTYATSLGYAYLHVGRRAEAARLFEDVLARSPDRWTLQKDLGYLYLHLGDNAKASHWLRRAVDAAPADQTSASNAMAAKRETQALRETLARVENRVDFSLYQVNQWEDGEKVPAGTPLGVGISPSQGGMELAYQPRRLGFQDERVFQLYTRLLWGTAPDSDALLDDETLQAGIGIRYKPLRAANLVVSGERRFAIGSAAADDWLLRAAYSWELRNALDSPGAYGRYAWLYADAAYAFGETDAGLFYGELREGLTWNVTDFAYVSPHVLVSTRAQQDDEVHDFSSNAGVGVAARIPFGNTRYSAGSAALEFTLQSTLSLSGDNEGWLFMGYVHF